MSDDVRVRPDLLSACEEAAEDMGVDVDAYIDQFPDETVLELDYEDLYSVAPVLIEDFHERPNLVASHFEQLLAGYCDDEELGTEIAKRATVRISGYDEDDVYDVGQYRPDSIAGQLIHLRGQVTQRSKRKLRDERVAFECRRCGRITRVPQSGDNLTEPHECNGCERGGPFDVDDRKTEMRDYQTIRLQTLPEETEDGETENVDLKVYDDLVGELTPGDRTVVNAVMRPKREKKSRVRILEGIVHSITKLTSDHTDVDVEPYRDRIELIANGEHDEYDDPFEAIIDSIAPNHEGDRNIKTAIAFQLFGGVEKELPNGKWFRGNSHLLLMGDPGTGKSSIIRYVSNLVPRAEFATGKQSTKAGLTASAVKDDFAEGGWTLEAGTLVRAHNGLAAIDELDKMSSDDRDGMIEAMSEQKITVNMVVSGVLPAKCSVLAAANPKYGSFNPMKDIGNQLDLDPVILSRFDLWFVLQDNADEEKDESIATTMTDSAEIGQKAAGDWELSDEEKDETEAPIPPEMFRAYVALGKRTFPVFTDEAKQRIVKEYVELRQMNDEDGPVPTTARLVEALHRLSEASARMRLGDEASLEDVERAIDIQRESLESLGVDPSTGELDAMRMETGTTSSKADRMDAVKGIIEGQSDDDSGAAYMDVKEEAMVLMDESEFEGSLEKLRRMGDVYEPSKDELRVA